MATLVFCYLSTVILLTAMLVVVLRNPIYSALSLLVMFFHVAGLYITLHAEFLAAIQIIVYAGAILVLYLFVVMLLNIKREERYHQQSMVGIILGVILLAEAILLVVTRGVYSLPSEVHIGDMVEPVTGNTEAIGMILFSKYLLPFEIASLILLVAMIGAVILSKKDIMKTKSS